MNARRKISRRVGKTSSPLEEIFLQTHICVISLSITTSTARISDEAGTHELHKHRQQENFGCFGGIGACTLDILATPIVRILNGT